MKPILLGILFLVAASCCKAQNVVYDENAEVRNVAAFTGIEVSGTVSLYISQGSMQGVAVSAGDEKFNNKIKTEVTNGVLHISVDGGVWNGFNWSNKKLKAYVTVTTLNKLGVSGASYITTTAPIVIDELKIEVSGASEIKAEVKTEKLSLDVSGASVVKISGTAQTSRIEASGATAVNCFNLVSTTCSAYSSGASSVRVNVTKELVAEASGGSSIQYKGNPSATNLNSSAGSSIKNKSRED